MYGELLTSLVSPCVLSYKILNEFKENTTVFRFNSKRHFHVMKTIKPAHCSGHSIFYLPFLSCTEDKTSPTLVSSVLSASVSGQKEEISQGLDHTPTYKNSSKIHLLVVL